MVELIAEVTGNLSSERGGADGISPGESACFMFADSRHTADTFTWWPDNFLQISVNSVTGYGGLIWYVGEERAEASMDVISKHVWISDNPEPPDFDPRVVSDPGFPLFFDPRSVLPVLQVRAALEEFCRTGTGGRPESIGWVRGETSGRRLHGIS
ncbi:Imm1 family immunity protein [Streptomyces sp. NPDC002324]